MTTHFENMTGAEIGRIFAPESIEDKEGWGRKTLRQIKADHDTVYAGLVALGLYGDPNAHLPPPYTGPDFTVLPVAGGFFNVATELLHSWLANTMGLLDTHRYRAPHAPRGTPPRKHETRKYFPKALKGHI